MPTVPASGSGRPVAPTRGVLQPLDLRDVRIGPGFWGDRQRLNGTVVIDHCREWMERLGWIGNFRVASGQAAGERRGREFTDADVYKLAEAMCWEAARIDRPGGSDLDAAADELSEVIAGAQEADGYLNTRFGHQGAEARYRDLEWGHELYCAGHLVQAGVARLRTHDDAGDHPLAVVATRVADHVVREFGDAGRPGVDGHPEIEMALVELYRASGADRYLEQARRFVERRGRPALDDIPFGRAYFQDDVPVRAATALRGHAVRALYLTAGVVDVAVETGDHELLEIIASQWRHTIATRTYLTGGMGSRHEGEAFGEDYELPPDRAYAETCAGVAAIMVAWRLLLATGEARYADLIERALYNVVATAVAADGQAFFYTNPLQVRVPPPVADPTAESPRAQAGLRAPWFTVSCCPPNVARLLASLSAYVATTARSALQLHQFVAGQVHAVLTDVGPVRLRVETDYPWSGSVTVQVQESPRAPWQLEVRVPTWAAGMRLALGDEVWPVAPAAGAGVTTRGYAVVDRAWSAGDELRMELPVRPRWTYPDPRLDAVRGCVAVERGPLVYCAESPATAPDDLTDDRLALVCVDDATAPDDSDTPVLGGAVAVDVLAHALEEPAGPPRRLPLIPYHLWGNRGPATMRVWLPMRPIRPIR